jgi:hypothetical protein
MSASVACPRSANNGTDKPAVKGESDEALETKPAAIDGVPSLSSLAQRFRGFADSFKSGHPERIEVALRMIASHVGWLLGRLDLNPLREGYLPLASRAVVDVDAMDIEPSPTEKQVKQGKGLRQQVKRELLAMAVAHPSFEGDAREALDAYARAIQLIDPNSLGTRWLSGQVHE